MIPAIVLKVIAVLFILDAVTLLMHPRMLRMVCEFLIEGTKIYMIGFIKATIGIIFLLGNRMEMTNAWIVVVFGTLALLGGAFVIIHPARAVELTKQFVDMPLGKLRLLGIPYLIIAVLLVYAT